MQMSVQVAAATFTAGLPFRAKIQAICAPYQFTFEDEPFVIDHVRVVDGPSVIRHPIFEQTIFTPEGGAMLQPAFQVRIGQEIEISVASFGQLEAAGESPVPDLATTSVTILFLVSAAVVNGVPQISVTYADVDLGPLISGVPEAPQIAAGIGVAMQSFEIPSMPLDLAPISNLLGAPANVSNIGVGTDALGTFVEIRMELNGPLPSSIANWSAFYQSPLTSVLNGHAWAMLLEKQTILDVIEDQIFLALSKAQDDEQFLLDSNITTTWKTSWPGAHVSFSGELPDLCPLWIGLFYAGMLDVSIDITIDFEFSVSTPNQLAMNVKFYWTLASGEVFACAVSAFHFWPAVGSVLMAEGKINGEFMVGMLVGPFFVVAGLLHASSEDAPDLGLEGLEFEPVLGTDADLEYVQRQDVVLGGGMELNAVFGVAQGLVLAGSFPTLAAVNHPPELITGGDYQFVWAFDDPCDNPVLAVSETVSCGNAAWQGLHTPLQVCSVVVLDDPLNQFGPYVKVDKTTIRVSVPIEGVLVAYTELAEPYPCKLLIITNGGARIITIPEFSTLTAAEQAELMIDLQITKAINCKLWGHFFWGKYFNPLWIPDPPDLAVVAKHLWHVVVAGSQQGGRVTVEDRDGRGLAIGTVGQKGQTELTAFVDGHLPASRPRIGAQPPARAVGNAPSEHAVAPVVAVPERPVGTIAIHQTLLVREAAIRFRGPVASVHGGQAMGAPALFCLTDGDLQVFDVSAPQAPRLAAHFSGLALEGFVPARGGGVGWGAQGLMRFDLEHGGRTCALESDTGGQVVSVVARRGYFYVLSSRRLTVRDREWRSVHSIEFEGFSELVLSGRRLIAGRDGSVVKLDVTRPQEPRPIGQYTVAGWIRLWDPRFVAEDLDVVFAADPAGGGRVWDLSDRLRAAVVASYPQDPWFVDMACVGPLVAEIESGGREVTVYRSAGSAGLREVDIDPTRTRAGRGHHRIAVEKLG